MIRTFVIAIGLTAGFLWAVSEPPPIDQPEPPQLHYEASLTGNATSGTWITTLASTSTTAVMPICTIGGPTTMTTMVYK